ncbi:ABC transporter family substrate-binding protein [Tsukamurella sp. PLM1]|uniref:ABC transporter family substrate-binding protein n=1 Tax=Tsukamurella sp. PLM1 TaxID=2929795 RepID=UPI0020C12D7A|nr:ABC transporter family substrate-binding protein [Tsukamurella sp. PLM1]
MQNTDLVPTVERPAPLQIVYTIRQDAQWSDGAPIAAEDFVYLWQSMITAPDTVGSAPYRQIESVSSGAGGKQVIVQLKAPLPGWRTLFQNLLPSHLVKGSPGGFNGAMREKIPASGAGYLVKKVDVARDEVTLERNDRYWMKPALVDRIVLRRGGSDAQLANSVRTGDVQVVAVHGGPSLLAQLTSIYQVRAIEQVDPRVLSLTLNTRSKFLADVAVRRALLDAINVDLLTTVGSGGDSVRPARAQVLAPSDPGYAPTMPARPAPAEAKVKLERALAGAGYSLQDAPIPPSQSVPPTPPPSAPTTTSAPSSSDPSALPVPPSPSPGRTSSSTSVTAYRCSCGSVCRRAIRPPSRWRATRPTSCGPWACSRPWWRSSRRCSPGRPCSTVPSTRSWAGRGPAPARSSGSPDGSSARRCRPSRRPPRRRHRRPSLTCRTIRLRPPSAGTWPACATRSCRRWPSTACRAARSTSRRSTRNCGSARPCCRSCRTSR